MLKSDLRKHALKQRKALSREETLRLSRLLLEQFKKLDLSTIKSIHLFLPIVEQNEPNTFLLIDWLQETHPEIRIIVPKSDFNLHSMSQHLYTDKADLKNNVHHIPEPQHAPVYTGMPDLVIVPLLVFDKSGFRVGYGKGFYDRFLQHITPVKIGLSFFEPTSEIIDVHLNDIRLDKCITPRGIINFSPLIDSLFIKKNGKGF